MRKILAFAPAVAAALALLLAGCRGGGPQRTQFVTVLDSPVVTLDPLDGIDAASERLRQLMFNSLMRKNEKFEYVGDLAESHEASEDGKTYTFKLRQGVTFHDGRPLTSADAKYTLDSLFSSNKKKQSVFFETVKGGPSQPYVTAVEAPDPQTVVVRLRKPWIQLLPNLVSVPVIPQGTADTQKTQPVGSGPFKFVRRDESQNIVDLAAFDAYFGGASAIKELRVRTILDANTLQAELQSGNIDLVSGVANLSPDSYPVLARSGRLKVEQFPGANIVYLGYNVEAAPLDNVKVRQAIAYAVDRESIVRDLLRGQARVAHSILPEASWAYDAGQKYTFDLNRARQLLDEAGFRDPDGDGPQMRFKKPVSFKISAGNAATSQFVGVIQNSLKSIGVPAAIETYETPTLITQLTNGQFELTTLRWVGGNQDPVFFRDLFHSNEIPGPGREGLRNRSRYRNPEFDRVIEEAIATTDREKARGLFVQAQQIVNRDVPLLPLWYPDVLVIARTGVENIKVDPSNDLSFLRSVTVAK
ncbi:MAG TPA: ABC transporter substrate-binding protein [Pyrinomonadaceae bacterium]|nr:ABC transporter substrate-binding protein [Pyrinomonadaceae bacterium]